MKGINFDGKDFETILFILDLTKQKIALAEYLENPNFENHPKLEEYFRICTDTYNGFISEVIEKAEKVAIISSKSDENQLVKKILDNITEKAKCANDFLDEKETLEVMIEKFKEADSNLNFSEDFKFPEMIKEFKTRQQVLYTQLSNTNTHELYDITIPDPEQFKAIFSKHDTPSRER